MTETVDRSVSVAAGPTFGLEKFRDPLRIPPVIRPHLSWHQDTLNVTMIRTEVRLHSQLPPTTVWAYDGHFPGPTIDVRSGRRLRITWTNEIEGKIPLIGVQAPITSAPQNAPGFRNPDGTLPAGVTLIDGVADLPSWGVVHLHGARTGGGNDGWAHNALLKGDSQLAEYPNAQPATTLWYHDHAMAITRFNVAAGLAGMYLIRDREEASLRLPSGEHEIPLIIADRNLDTDADGDLTGQLLYKVPFLTTASGQVLHIPFSGPFTLVNGVIWPHLDVEARWYRFRVVNTSNARFYRLRLVDEDTGESLDRHVRQIGTDSGLLPRPAALPTGGLLMAPAERADLLIDFARLRGRRLKLTNAQPNAAPEPDIMQFRVEDRERRDRFRLPTTLSPSYVRLHHGTTVPDDHDHIFIALVPPGTGGEGHPGMWELVEVTDPERIPTTLPAPGILQITDPNSGRVRTFERVASLFDDTTSVFIDHDRWAVWNFLQLGGPAHPMHVHLARFQALTRTAYPIDPATGAAPGFDVAVGGTTTPLPVPGPGRALDPQEEGWKDTYVVGAGEWLTIAGRFDGATGNFMYHCHILDHEDEGMMRPFVVMPREAARFHVHRFGGGHHHGEVAEDTRSSGNPL
ncbi:multicopper oxidase domain-containing protein [Saccharothrix violaceirubra]|uniref:FtsP/CotA-like multicopper oxidase with cupredoxin domain n=1 Tax=Saccharothrix violaceirubra TaxID=413306 RepID=A0A7W7WWL9_9PSEU|nr:multicopper oxidase domain-containing protein [Saccharothrix violaceirubra]MBB4966514.1 FtsP/CotA-like multicopper oxidase with cupredoxin domain [Saccharothrix violaceirubra]